MEDEEVDLEWQEFLKTYVEIPREFPFPFKPYDIQLDFMKKLYETIELGRIGIFESPTGTGKSQSLICGSLLWLKHFEEKKQKELNNLLKEKNALESGNKEKKDAGGSDWIQEFAKKQEQEERAKKLEEEQELRRKREEKLNMLKADIKVGTPKRKRDVLEEQFDNLFHPDEKLKNTLESQSGANENVSVDGDDDLMVADYMSEEEHEEEEGEDDCERDEVASTEEHVTKIYYCSRTHSQLAQFVNEVRRSPYGEDTKVVNLGSRQNMCINEAIKKLKSLSLINDRCLDMQKAKNAKKSGDEPTSKKAKASTGCPFYKKDNISGFADRILVEVKDIEDLITTGKELTACPYYASRRAVPSAQLVVLPYNSILHKSTREASGIKLDNNILIIDEGHNLLETIANIHNVEVTGFQLNGAKSQLTKYQERFKSRLKAKNLMYIKQLLFIVSNCIRVLEGTNVEHFGLPDKRPRKDNLISVNDFLFEARIDNLNFFKIGRYCKKSNISKKLHGFVQRCSDTENQGRRRLNVSLNSSGIYDLLNTSRQNPMDMRRDYQEPAKDSNVSVPSFLYHIESFIDALTNVDKDGRIIIKRQVDDLDNSSLKFLMLNPSVHFKEVAEKCRSVIIAGGTMQPVSDFKEQLLLNIGVEKDKIMTFSCGHVIPEDQLITVSLGRGPSGKELNFTYKNREETEIIKELGRVMQNVCSIVPAGVVCFFPSYEYEETVLKVWDNNGFTERIQAKKKIFREPKRAGDVEKTLRDYSKFIESHSISSPSSTQTGAILFCVVGGKMSEGINFSDDLGRCVVMVGLPYPNKFAVEIEEKVAYLNNSMPEVDGKPAGQHHYENLCMKAINQSIGRAIRHRNDYAAILLLDTRFLRPAVTSKLPEWIQRHLLNHNSFGPAFAALKKFFNKWKPKDDSSVSVSTSLTS